MGIISIFKLNIYYKLKPKSKMLLSIASKMFLENIINKTQRGILKELILSNDQSLIHFLNDYENNGNSDLLYGNIIKLIEEYQMSINK